MGLIGLNSDRIIDGWDAITKNWYCLPSATPSAFSLLNPWANIPVFRPQALVIRTMPVQRTIRLKSVCSITNRKETVRAVLRKPTSQRQFPFETLVCTLAIATFQPILVDVIERRCTVCTEHVIHQASISGHAPSGLEQDLVNEADELRGRYNGVWNEHELNDVNQAGLMYRRKFAMAGANQGEALTQTQRQRLLELRLALDLCSQSCPSCRGDGSVNLFPVHLAGYVTNRATLDAALGNWTDHSVGYKMSTRDLEEIQQLRGEPCPSEQPGTWSKCTRRIVNPFGTRFTIHHHSLVSPSNGTNHCLNHSNITYESWMWFDGCVS